MGATKSPTSQDEYVYAKCDESADGGEKLFSYTDFTDFLDQFGLFSSFAWSFQKKSVFLQPKNDFLVNTIRKSI